MHGHISHTDNLKHNPIMRFINEQKPTYHDDRDKLAFIETLCSQYKRVLYDIKINLWEILSFTLFHLFLVHVVHS